MRTLDIAAAREMAVAYGQSSSAWAASTINTWIGVIIAVVYLASAVNIMRDKQKDESGKIKGVALLTVAAVIVAGVVMVFINNKFGGPAGRIGDVLN
ncbi:hypothetical protein KL864_31910 [Mycolicibacterium goodii]|uniref:hypothetical protein n=1 Tax=Mycolicibacterium goodii TaxID=134601 RepID=UPI001BDC8358|nr:hypothetical protein [Mycolicibacterium goodii]MBU8820482.1 hypothetical protein [Mycolicibacterium goodii]